MLLVNVLACLLSAMQATAVATSEVDLLEKQCKSDVDCELLGTCTASGICKCRPGFHGPSCGSLDLAPVDQTIHGAVWPPLSALASNSTFSWGFTVVYDERDGLYHAAVNAGCCDLPRAIVPPSTCSVKVGGTSLVHVTSKYPDRGFVQAGIFMAPTAFNPHLIRAKNGTFILYFRVNDLAEYTVCTGDGKRANSSTLPTYIDRHDITHTDPSGEGPGANMYVSWSDTMAGPWHTQQVVITGMGKLHISNPSITFLDSGKVMLAYRFNPAHGEQIGFAMADSFLGPFVSSSNLTKAPGNDEDPFLWQEHYDKSLHILYHNGPHGFHAFSKDGAQWHKSPTSSFAFELALNVSDGSTFRLARRERPEILFDSSGTPRFFYNGVNTLSSSLPGKMNQYDYGPKQFGHAFSLVQPVRRHGMPSILI